MTFRDLFHKEKLKEWFVTHADSKKATVALALISFFEAIIFPIPPDFFLVAILAANKARRWAYYSFVTSIFSVAGGVASYFVGYLFFDTLGQRIIEWYGIGSSFETAAKMFTDNAFWAVLVAAITPLPDKLFNLVAGLFKVDPLVFLLAYIIARSARFFAVGFIMKLFGVRIARVIYRHLSLLSVILMIAVVGVVVLALVA